MNRHARALITAVDRVIERMAGGYRCPFCPADVTRDHNRTCPAMAMLRARDEFVRVETFVAAKPQSRTSAQAKDAE